MKLRFTKMHGLGNDFVVFDGVRQVVQLTPSDIRRLADRHFGVGCDQVLLVEKAQNDDVDFRYRIFNADGQEVEQCGNGARCFARFVLEEQLTARQVLRVETAKGVITLRVLAEGWVTVDMGSPCWTPEAVPIRVPQEELTYALDWGQQVISFGALSMGNPHAVIQVEDLTTAPVDAQGRWLNESPNFPAGVNVGSMQIVSPQKIRLRVYERGVGETLACGTGACAAVVYGIRCGLLVSPVEVSMPGGSLSIAWAGPGTSVQMTGPAVTVFRGEWGVEQE